MKNCCAERHTFTPKVCDIRAKTPSAAHLIHGDTRDTRGAASRRPQDQGSVCARAHRRSGAACFLSLSHCPLPMQNSVLSESCAHLFFCMRLAEGISWPAAASAGVAKQSRGRELRVRMLLPAGNKCCLQATIRRRPLERVPMGHAAATTGHTEELNKVRASIESMNRIEKLTRAWKPW